MRLTTLAEALEATRGSLPLNLELKAGPGDRALPGKVVAALRRAGRIRDTLVTSFAPRLVLAARRLAPRLRIGVILAAPVHAFPASTRTCSRSRRRRSTRRS